jgi:hypothetical protein
MREISMGRIKALVLSVFVSVLTAGAGCETEDGTGGTGGAGGSGGTDGTCDDFSGTWTGTFQCIYRDPSECGQPFGGDIDIEVMQQGCDATYSDGSDTFAGTVSDNVFEFHETSDPPTETGTLTLLTPNTAHKESTFTTSSGCIGDCEDDLSRF